MEIGDDDNNNRKNDPIIVKIKTIEIGKDGKYSVRETMDEDDLLSGIADVNIQDEIPIDLEPVQPKKMNIRWTVPWVKYALEWMVQVLREEEKFNLPDQRYHIVIAKLFAHQENVLECIQKIQTVWKDIRIEQTSHEFNGKKLFRLRGLQNQIYPFFFTFIPVVPFFYIEKMRKINKTLAKD